MAAGGGNHLHIEINFNFDLTYPNLTPDIRVCLLMTYLWRYSKASAFHISILSNYSWCQSPMPLLQETSWCKGNTTFDKYMYIYYVIWTQNIRDFSKITAYLSVCGYSAACLLLEQSTVYFLSVFTVLFLFS